jgi:hypothetical protein
MMAFRTKGKNIRLYSHNKEDNSLLFSIVRLRDKEEGDEPSCYFEIHRKRAITKIRLSRAIVEEMHDHFLAWEEK